MSPADRSAFSDPAAVAEGFSQSDESHQSLEHLEPREERGINTQPAYQRLGDSGTPLRAWSLGASPDLALKLLETSALADASLAASDASRVEGDTEQIETFAGSPESAAGSPGVL